MLDLVVGGHSKVASLGEFSFLGKALALKQPCTCGAEVASCPHWRAVFDALASEHGIDLREEPYALEEWFSRASTVIDVAHQTPAYITRLKAASAWCDFRYAVRERLGWLLPLTPHLNSSVANMSLLFDQVARQWEMNTLVDSSKNVHRALAMYEAAPERVKVLLLTRDGRGVYHSRRTSGFSRKEAMDGWRRYNRRAHRLLSRHVPEQALHRVHYEAIVQSPETEVAKICEFLDIEFEEAMLTIRPTSSHLVNGNDMRLKGTQQLRADERWKTEMSTAELAWFTRHDGGTNRDLGYD